MSKNHGGSQLNPTPTTFIPNQEANLADISTKNDHARPLAAPISDKLALADAVLVDLEQQIDPLALDAALDKDGAAAALAKLRKQIDTARANRDDLARALKLARRKDAIAAAETRNRIARSQLRRVEKFATARLEAMQELSRAIEAAAKAYRAYAGATDTMRAAIPIGTAIPDGSSMGSAGEYGSVFDPTRVIATEFYRHSGVSQIGDRGAFPGSSPPSEYFRYQPEAITPAPTLIEQANEYIISTIKLQLRDTEAAEREGFGSD
jgi:multidrug efflux pump subunit AcrA (membrane-fusion protein)